MPIASYSACVSETRFVIASAPVIPVVSDAGVFRFVRVVAAAPVPNESPLLINTVPVPLPDNDKSILVSVPIDMIVGGLLALAPVTSIAFAADCRPSLILLLLMSCLLLVYYI